MIDSSMILKATFEKIIESINIGIFDLLHTGVALFCDKGFFIYCNKSFLKMYNLPESVIGKHITDYFLTGERGVMSSIRTRKMVICSSQTKNNVWGVSFRYPIQDEQGQLTEDASEHDDDGDALQRVRHALVDDAFNLVPRGSDGYGQNDGCDQNTGDGVDLPF